MTDANTERTMLDHPLRPLSILLASLLLVALQLASACSPETDATSIEPADAAGAQASDAQPADAQAPPTDAGPPERDDAAPPPEAWCGHQWPPTVETVAGRISPAIYGRYWLSPEAASHPVRFELGYGPVNSTPGPDWTWQSAEQNHDCDCGDEAEFIAHVRPNTAGEYNLAWRLTLGDTAPIYGDRRDDGRQGSGDGYSVDDAARLVVQSTGPLRVASVNLRCLIDDWPARRPLLIAALAEADPDLLALQEICQSADEDALAQLLEGLSAATGRQYYVARTVTHRAWDQFDEGLGVVSATPIEAQQIVALPANRLPRAAVMVRTQTSLGAVVFTSTHLTAESEEAGARGAQADTIRAALNTWAPADAMRLVAGDFNEGPGGPATGGMTDAGYADLWALSHPDDPGHTFPAVDPQARIDHIFAQPAPVHVETERFLYSVDGRYPSDHLGVRAVLHAE